MKQSMTIVTGMLLMTSIVTGCDRHEDRAEGVGDAISAAPTPPADASASPAAKSIIRPTVIETSAPPPLEIEKLAIPFADRDLTLSEEAQAQLNTLMDSRTMQAGGPIVLRGHSDSRGYDGDNLVTSRKRAEVVRAYLESKGVPRERMSVIALGETRPVAPNARLDGSDDPEGRARNRRVEIEVQPPRRASEDNTDPARRDDAEAASR
jgi:OOP family OmpA-OmpF porin